MTVAFELMAALRRAERRSTLQVQRRISLVINCALAAGDRSLLGQACEGGDPKAQQCGWLKDKYGVSWQVVPTDLPALVTPEGHAQCCR
jgi:predicted 3-demethylubiquinone-9 3-methyltransferase (glyoxalase superfamily)